jgi:hypothetical protein
MKPWTSRWRNLILRLAVTLVSNGRAWPSVRKSSFVVPLCHMTKLLEEAIDKIRELPEDRQAYAAAMLEIIAAQDHGVYRLTDEERTSVQAGLAEIGRGEIASDEDVAAMWNRFGL